MANIYEVTKKIGGKNYTAQFTGLSTALEAVDGCYIEGSNNISSTKMANYLFKNVIVEPQGLTIDSFDNMDDFNDVVTFAREVMQGKFRDKANTPSTDEKGKG